MSHKIDRRVIIRRILCWSTYVFRITVSHIEANEGNIHNIHNRINFSKISITCTFLKKIIEEFFFVKTYNSLFHSYIIFILHTEWILFCLYVIKLKEMSLPLLLVEVHTRTDGNVLKKIFVCGTPIMPILNRVVLVYTFRRRVRIEWTENVSAF